MEAREPFWRTMPVRTLLNRAVRVTYTSHAVIHGMLDYGRVSTDCNSLYVADDRNAGVNQPIVTIHADGTRDLADPDIVSVMLEPAGRITRVERVDDPSKWEPGDIIVLRDGGEWTITDTDPGRDGGLRAVYPMLGIETGIPKAYVDHALRPHPYLPDHPGLWRSLTDDGLYIAARGETGLVINAIRDAAGAWTLASGMPADGIEASRLAPFIQVDDIIPDDWITHDENRENTGEQA